MRSQRNVHIHESVRTNEFGTKGNTHNCILGKAIEMSMHINYCLVVVDTDNFFGKK